jgi:DNA-binding transcriptional ArsR family regulator
MSRPLPTMPDLADVFKALSDPTRWTIVEQMAAVPELACTALESMLPVSKPTISYHIKVLYYAGLVEVRKEGRYYFYRLRRETFEDALSQMHAELGNALQGV